MEFRRWKALASAVALTATLGLVAAGCGDDDSAAGGSSAPASDLKAGLVSDVGKFNDRSFNQSALEGLQRAETELGVQGRPIESTAAGDYIANLTTLARADYDLTVGVGFLMADAISTVAKKFPESNFAIVDFPNAALKGTPANVRGLNFATNENSYLIGYMASKMAEAEGGTPVISAVGGLKIPTVDIFIAGYRAGALAANPKTKVLIDYSQDFVQQSKCKEKALDQISKGSKVVFQVAGGCGLGALSAAADEGVWGVGVDRDQSDLGDHILTSAVKRVDTSVYESIKAVQDGTFTGGDDANFGLANDGVALGTTSPEVPQSLLDEVDSLKQQIIDGTVTVPAEL